MSLHRLTSASLLLGGALLAGRATGLVREMQLGAVFGLSSDADLAVLLLTTPDLLSSLLLAGGLNAALVPEFRQLPPADRTTLLIQAFAVAILGFGAIATVIAWSPEVLFYILAPGLLAVSSDEYAAQVAIAAIAIPLAACSAVLAAYLNSQHRFFVVGIGTLIFNSVVIVALIAGPGPVPTTLVLAMAIVAGAIARVLSQFLGASGTLSTPRRLWARGASAGLERHFIAAFGATTIILLIPIALRSLVSLEGRGNLAAFNFAIKLYELPMAIAIASLSTVAYPMICDFVHEKNDSALRRFFGSALRRAIGTALAIAVPAAWFAPALVGLVFGHGAMTDRDLELITDLSRILFVALPAAAATAMSTALINARGEIGRLLRLTILMTIVLAPAVVPGLLSSEPRLIAAAMPVAYLLYSWLLLRATGYRVGGRDGLLPWSIIIQSLIASLMPTVLLGALWALTWPTSDTAGSVCAGLATLAGLFAIKAIRATPGGPEPH